MSPARSVPVEPSGRDRTEPSGSEIEMSDITPEMARRQGFEGLVDLLKIAKHGPGERIFLVEFEYRPAA